MRYRLIKDLYDEHDVLKSEELQRLTPGTPEFTVLDATVRRERGNSIDAYFGRLNQAIQYEGALVGDMPGFSDDVVSRLRSLFALDARQQNYIVSDDALSYNLLDTYMWVRNIALTVPAPAVLKADEPVISTYDFERELAHDFATLYARRGDPDPYGTAIRTNAARWPRARKGRPLAPLELQRMKGHWSVLGHESSVHKDEHALACQITEKASVTITSDKIEYRGWSTLNEGQKIEAVRLGVLHAREHWNGAHEIRGYVPDHTLYTLAFSELLGVRVLGMHLAISQEEIDACKSKLQEIYPKNSTSRSNDVEERELRCPDPADGPTRPNVKPPSRRSFLSLFSRVR